jgi:hypothetical protein
MNPGVPFSTANALILFSFLAFWSVTAQTTVTPETSPLVIKLLVPLRI